MGADIFNIEIGIKNPYPHYLYALMQTCVSLVLYAKEDAQQVCIEPHGLVGSYRPDYLDISA